VAGDEPDMVRKMRVGQLQAASLTGVGLSNIVPEVQALQMPRMIRSYEELDFVLGRLAPKLEGMLEAKGFKVLNWGDAGWVHYFSAKPIVRPADLKTQKLFVWSGDTTYIEAYKDLGYQPVPLPLTEMHSGLQSGLVNAFAATPLAALSFQWFGSAKNMVDVRWAPLLGATVITKEAWAKIPEDAKPKLLEAAVTAGERMKLETRKLGDDAVATMKKHGLVVHAVPPDAVADWDRAAEAAYPKLAGKVVPEAMLQEVRKVRDEYAARK
jgi:TRAP-type C4-dicarboxylate transport system substrate-binding protein